MGWVQRGDACGYRRVALGIIVATELVYVLTVVVETAHEVKMHGTKHTENKHK